MLLSLATLAIVGYSLFVIILATAFGVIIMALLTLAFKRIAIIYKDATPNIDYWKKVPPKPIIAYVLGAIVAGLFMLLPVVL